MVAGLDIGKSENYVSIHQEVKKFSIEKLENMVEYLQKKQVKSVILEPTGVYSIPVIEALSKYFTVYIVPTYLIAKFKGNNPQKNDTIDAKTLEKYYYSEEHQFHKYPVSEKYLTAKKLNILISELESLKKTKTREINRLRGDMYIIDKNTHNLSEAKLLKITLKSDNPTIRLRSERIVNIKESIKITENIIVEHVEKNEFIKKQVDLIMTIPNFSYNDACMIVSKIVDVNNFKTVRAFKKFLGFGVNKEESGTSIRRTKKVISHRVIKSKFYLFLLRNLKNSGDANIKRAIYYYKFKYNNHFKALMKVASRVVIRIYYMLKYEKPYDKSIEYIDNKTIQLVRTIIELETSKITDNTNKKKQQNTRVLEFLDIDFTEDVKDDIIKAG